MLFWNWYLIGVKKKKKQDTPTKQNLGTNQHLSLFRACLLGGYSRRGNFSHISLENALKRLHARQGSPPIRGTRLGGITFYHVYCSCRAIPASRGEISRENMAARSEFFRSYH